MIYLEGHKYQEISRIYLGGGIYQEMKKFIKKYQEISRFFKDI